MHGVGTRDEEHYKHALMDVLCRVSSIDRQGSLVHITFRNG